MNTPPSVHARAVHHSRQTWMMVSSWVDRRAGEFGRHLRKDEQTKPSAKMAVDWTSQVRDNRGERSQGGAPKRRSARNEANMAAPEPTSARENRQRRRIPPVRPATLHPPPDSGILHALAPGNGYGTWVKACDRWDSSCAGRSGDNGSSDSPQEARTTRRERGIRSEDSGVSHVCIEFAASGVFALQSRPGELRPDRRVDATYRRRP